MKDTTRRYTRRGVVAWCLYDWGNSAFSTIILTFVFAAYFTEKIAINKVLGMAQWARAIAIAGLIIAVISPFLGAIADHEGRRKPWIAGFAAVSILSAALLWFAKPMPSFVTWTLVWLAVGVIGLEVSVVFYNAMLRDLAPDHYVGRISGWAWGVGYLGGLCSLLLVLWIFINGNWRWAWLDNSMSESIRLCGPLVAIWYAVFALPLFIWTPDTPSRGVRFKTAIQLGLKQLLHTLHTLPSYKEILKFLLARMLYIDGLNTIFAFGGIYAAGTLGMNFTQLIEFGIAMNVAAGIGAIGFAWVDDWIGAKTTIIIALCVMLVSGTLMLLAHRPLLFWIFGMFLCLCVGPVQAASRSLMVHLVPPHLVNEMFGLYAFSGKVTAFVGPWLVSIFTLQFDSQRVGMSTVMLMLLLGTLMLCFVKEPTPRPSLS
ncbi:MAG: MFS transporter [Coxiella sp. RIFCSPHIGHO2_12_FULL_44_14]|nr:MAG: MFS transporter [Coxiella sp. RIFCSPHIGHO2_12_FULL_44_14]